MATARQNFRDTMQGFNDKLDNPRMKKLRLRKRLKSLKQRDAERSLALKNKKSLNHPERKLNRAKTAQAKMEEVTYNGNR